MILWSVTNYSKTLQHFMKAGRKIVRFGLRRVPMKGRRAYFTSASFATEKHPNLLLLLVPRHPERFNPVADLIEKANFHFIRRSTGRFLQKIPK